MRYYILRLLSLFLIVGTSAMTTLADDCAPRLDALVNPPHLIDPNNSSDALQNQIKNAEGYLNHAEAPYKIPALAALDPKLHRSIDQKIRHSNIRRLVQLIRFSLFPEEDHFHTMKGAPLPAQNIKDYLRRLDSLGFRRDFPEDFRIDARREVAGVRSALIQKLAAVRRKLQFDRLSDEAIEKHESVVYWRSLLDQLHNPDSLQKPSN